MNPYKILEIDSQAGKKEIILAAAAALRKRKFSGHEIANAQKQLIDPASRPIINFLYSFNFEPLKESLITAGMSPATTVETGCLKRLSLFDKDFQA